MNVKAKLRHFVTVTKVVGQSVGAEPSMSSTPVSSIACFIDGIHRRVLRANGREVLANFSIYFLPGADVGIDDLVSNGVTRKGVTVLSAGRIVSLEKSFHPSYGLVVQEALVEGN